MQIPHLNKIVLNIGLGQKLIANKKEIVKTLLALELIGSQRAVATKAKKSIDKFKLKKKMMIGSKLTLRRRNMFFFLDRLTNDVLPNLENLEDFHRKYKKGFSGKNKSSSLVNKKISRNCSWSVGFGLPDFFSFKEIPFDKFDSTYGLDISLNIKQGVNAKKGILVKKRKSYNLGTQSLGVTEKVFKKPFYSKILSNDSVSCTKSKKVLSKTRKLFLLTWIPWSLKALINILTRF